MQLDSFDPWAILISLLSVFGGCGAMQTANHSQPVTLTMPKNDGTTDYSAVSTKLTLILLNDRAVYAYEGQNLNAGSIYPEAKIRSVIVAAKLKFTKEKFVVVIKPTDGTDYGSTVDMLDEMAINKIDRYSIENLSEDEKQKLNVRDQSK